MQAAMGGMGSLAGYSFTQLTPAQPSYNTAPSHPQQQQQQPGVPSTSAALPLPGDISMKGDIPGCSSVASIHSDSIRDASSTYDAYGTSESNPEMEPCVSSLRSSVSPRSQEEHVIMAPFDAYDALEQEKKKLERKRARNRLAATKCRQRKLQKINDLEKQVAEEKQRGSRLDEDMKLLEASVTHLRQLLQKHQNNGCVVPSKVISA
ncbi:unnamed protein product [Gongylonema pulchrum]|uniref:BZIP domain-containing protein n=1 Tax=Gongylonema pulchrum TaxID=637853 RepID=A0A183E1M4_9BILA|nr:unnamed protein product [Gongylonema pulchrum]